MKAYATWGPRYLDNVKTFGGTLNLERILFGLPQGVDNILPLSMKSIRYNDPAILGGRIIDDFQPHGTAGRDSC